MMILSLIEIIFYKELIEII